MDAIIIFFLIGAAHWAVHILQCGMCAKTISNNLTFLLEGVFKVCGWPIELIGYLAQLFKPEPEIPATRVKAKISDGAILTLGTAQENLNMGDTVSIDVLTGKVKKMSEEDMKGFKL